MIQLIIYAVVAAALLGGAMAAWSGFKNHIGQPYAEAQRLADQRVVDRAGEAQKQAESDRDTARGNKDRCETALGVANKGKEEADKKAKERADESRKVKAESDRKDAAARPYIAGLEVRAAAAPKLQKCEDEMAAARPVLQEALRRGRIAPPGAK